MPGPSRSGSVPSGSSSGWQHHFVMLIDVSRGLWSSKQVRWAFSLCNPLGVLLVPRRPSCPCPFLPTLLLSVLMVPWSPPPSGKSVSSLLTAQRTFGCSEPILSTWHPFCFSAPSWLPDVLWRARPLTAWRLLVCFMTTRCPPGHSPPSW